MAVFCCLCGELSVVAHKKTQQKKPLSFGLGSAVRGGLAFSDTKPGLHKWTNCSIVTACKPIERSRSHETVTQEPLFEVQSPGRPRSTTGRGNARRARPAPRRACLPDYRLAQATV